MFFYTILIPRDVPGTKLSVTEPLLNEPTNGYVKAIKSNIYIVKLYEYNLSTYLFMSTLIPYYFLLRKTK